MSTVTDSLIAGGSLALAQLRVLWARVAVRARLALALCSALVTAPHLDCRHAALSAGDAKTNGTGARRVQGKRRRGREKAHQGDEQEAEHRAMKGSSHKRSHERAPVVRAARASCPRSGFMLEDRYRSRTLPMAPDLASLSPPESVLPSNSCIFGPQTGDPVDQAAERVTSACSSCAGCRPPCASGRWRRSGRRSKRVGVTTVATSACTSSCASAPGMRSLGRAQ